MILSTNQWDSCTTICMTLFVLVYFYKFSFQHPDFSGPDEADQVLNDIALLKLSVPADLSSEYISAATLVPADYNELFADCFITGWGYDEEGKSMLKPLRTRFKLY